MSQKPEIIVNENDFTQKQELRGGPSLSSLLPPECACRRMEAKTALILTSENHPAELWLDVIGPDISVFVLNVEFT